ncbi:hypothetical protein BDQ12DRAFT_118693 [Crucibulum laeve]|uniref:Uncharacterized protein n=1 Tax=Crucibulum laeve TaxID=68775 RepID=A0A5C3LI26_9AGAR|nr:hypothetical protein BDQ12DRAFT_118693 [Crucibulum laeve]
MIDPLSGDQDDRSSQSSSSHSSTNNSGPLSSFTGSGSRDAATTAKRRLFKRVRSSKCVITNEEQSDNEAATLVSTNDDDALMHLEFMLGLKYKQFHIHGADNTLFLRPDMCKEFREGEWYLLPEPKLLTQLSAFCRHQIECRKDWTKRLHYKQFFGTKSLFRYQFIPLKSRLQCELPILRRKTGLEPDDNNNTSCFATVPPPYDNFFVESHVNPLLVAINAALKLPHGSTDSISLKIASLERVVRNTHPPYTWKYAGIVWRSQRRLQIHTSPPVTQTTCCSSSGPAIDPNSCSVEKYGVYDAPDNRQGHIGTQQRRKTVLQHSSRSSGSSAIDTPSRPLKRRKTEIPCHTYKNIEGGSNSAFGPAFIISWVNEQCHLAASSQFEELSDMENDSRPEWYSKEKVFPPPENLKRLAKDWGQPLPHEHADFSCHDWIVLYKRRKRAKNIDRDSGIPSLYISM